MNDCIFAVDIGTRKIIGLLARLREGVLEVVDYRYAEHESRIVRAGQIHDIEKVARIVQEIKRQLENSNNIKITEVATAIAGRNLKSYRCCSETVFADSKELTSSDIRNLEIDAIQNLLRDTSDALDDYYFAGYTVNRYELDDEIITAPVGHYCNKVKVELIATFLPRKVLESLFAVLKKSELQISYLTLEPIAAQKAVLQEDMKNISIVLVDIGAGTSDIAVISQGAVQAIGMVPCAGDSITEFLCGEYLVGFNEGERIKKEIGSDCAFSCQPTDTVCVDSHPADTISFTDIFGRKYEKSKKEMQEKIRPAVNELARRIADEIHKLTTAPLATNFAIVLVGGGSLTPYLREELSAGLNIPVERIGIRTPKMNLSLSDLPDTITGPSGAVACGISLLAFQSNNLTVLHLTINGQKVEVVNFQGDTSVLSALLFAGIEKRKIFGRPGNALTFTLNNELKIIKGSFPESAKVYLNGLPADLNSLIKDGDKIEFVPAIDGTDASLKISDIISDIQSCDKIFYNGKETPLPLVIKVNGAVVDENYEIKDRDFVEFETDYSLFSFLKSQGISQDNFEVRKISIDLNGTVVEKELKNFILKHNEKELTSIENILLKKGDNLVVEFIENPRIKIGEILKPPAAGREMRVKINGEEFILPGHPGKILLNGREATPDDIVDDGDIIRTVAGKDAEAVLVDIFRYISVNPQDSLGKKLRLLVNEQEANFTTPLSDGAEIKVGFE